MNYGFLFTEQSMNRNQLSFNMEPIQPVLLLEFIAEIGATRLFDVGANIGLYALVGTLAPTVRAVDAFEASPVAFRTLEANIAFNDLEARVTSVQMAVSDAPGRVAFQIAKPLSGINSIAETSFHRKSLFKRIIEVESCALDDYAPVSDEILAFKIDVEGHETHVIAGATQIFTRNCSIIQIECYRDGEVAVREALGRLGYRQIFRVDHDFYFSNDERLFDPARVVAVMERAATKLVHLSQGLWPKPRVETPLTLTAKRSGDLVTVNCAPAPGLFRGPLEFALYVSMENKRLATLPYQGLPQFSCALPQGCRGEALQLTGFAREVAFPDKKVMVGLRVESTSQAS